jgi:hypothetical protein
VEGRYKMLKGDSIAINSIRNPASLAVFLIEVIVLSFVRR